MDERELEMKMVVVFVFEILVSTPRPLTAA